MALTDSALEPEALAYARGLLKPRLARDSIWTTLIAVGLLAVTSIALAFAILTSPPPGSMREPVEKAPATSS